MERSRGHRLRVPILACALLVGGCSGLVASVAPASPSGGPGSAIATPWVPPVPTGLTCGDLFSPPAYDALPAVPGITVRAVDKAHLEIRNATANRYYFAVFSWETHDNLVCGRGVTFSEGANGSVAPGSAVVVDGGSTIQVPETVSIWGEPCGEACDRAPIGQYLVPLSLVEAPSPIRTD